MSMISDKVRLPDAASIVDRPLVFNHRVRQGRMEFLPFTVGDLDGDPQWESAIEEGSG